MKNRAKTPGQILVEFVSKPRSAVYKEICAASTDENGFQSDAAGARVRSEMKSVLTDLLSGRNFDQINQALCRHASQKKEVTIRAVGENKYSSLDFYIAETRRVFLGRKNICHVDAIYPNPETAHELIYGVLKRALESGGDIGRLGLCRRQGCQKIWYRKNLKGEFCCGQCRWKHRNEISATKSKLNKKSRKTESQNELATVALKRMQKYIRDKRIRDVADLPLSCVDNPFGKLRNLLGERFDVSVIIERLWNEPAESLVKTLPARVNTALSKSF